LQFIKKGSPNNQYITYKHIDKNNAIVEFDTPKEDGEYEFRYHQSKYVDVVRSPLLVIENTDSVNIELKENGKFVFVTWDIFSQTQSNRDWIAIYRPDEKNNRKYIKEFKYVDLVVGGILFESPTQPGEYEVRYFSYNLGSFTDFRKSRPFIIN